MHDRATFIERTEKLMPETCLSTYRMILGFLTQDTPFEQMRGFQGIDSLIQVTVLLKMSEVNKEYIDQNKIIWTPNEYNKIEETLAFVENVRLGAYSISVLTIDDYGAMCFDANYARAVLEHGFILQRLEKTLNNDINLNSQPEEGAIPGVPSHFGRSLSFWKDRMANRWRSTTPICPAQVETNQNAFTKTSEFWKRRW